MQDNQAYQTGQLIDYRVITLLTCGTPERVVGHRKGVSQEFGFTLTNGFFYRVGVRLP